MKMLIFGSLNIDHVYRVPHLVRGGETLSSVSYQKNAGGKGLNQAIALAQAGQKVSFCGAIGADGQFLKDYLASFGVDVSRIYVMDEPTGHAMIQLDEHGQNAILLYGGANQKISAEMIDAVLADCEPGDCILLQNEISRLEEIVRGAHEKKMRVILNPSPMCEALKPLLPFVDDLILNEVEGADWTGRTAPDDILDALLERCPDCRVMLTLGINGSVYADKARRVHQDAILAETVDTTAAGDTFTGFFYHGMLSGMPLERAMFLAAQASSIAVSRPGAGGSIPSMDEVLQKAALNTK